MPASDRSKRKYGFGDHSAPTKREVLEIVERGRKVTKRVGEIEGIMRAGG